MRLGLLKPTQYVSRPFGDPLEIRRCDTDGGLVIPSSQASLSVHAGHRVKAPTHIKVSELILIAFRVIR